MARKKVTGSMLPRLYRIAVQRSIPWPCATVNLPSTQDSTGCDVCDPVRFTMEDTGVPENANADRPRVLRSKLTLQDGERSGSCYVDREFMAMVQAGDQLFIGLTERGGVGVSVLRDSQLIVAAGAVSAVPLGRDVTLTIAPERWEEAVSERRLSPRFDPRTHYVGEWPLAIRVGSSESLLFRTNMTIDGVHVYARHGFRSIDQHRDAECVALTRLPGDEVLTYPASGYGPVVVANASALLLTADGFAVEPA